MPTDLTIILRNTPGTLADMGEALGRAGVNIEGPAAFTHGDEGTVHILVEDSAKARAALEAAGIRVSAENDVLVLNLENKPGALGEASRKIADAGVNIEQVYTASDNRLIFVVDDLEKAKAAI